MSIQVSSRIRRPQCESSALTCLIFERVARCAHGCFYTVFLDSVRLKPASAGVRGKHLSQDVFDVSVCSFTCSMFDYRYHHVSKGPSASRSGRRPASFAAIDSFQRLERLWSSFTCMMINLKGSFGCSSKPTVHTQFGAVDLPLFAPSRSS